MRLTALRAVGRQMTKSQKFRRLTRKEAKLRGVSYSSKHQVSADVKRVTKRTKTYTNRKAAELRTGEKRETFAASQIERVKLKSEKFGVNYSTHYKGLSKQNLIRILKKNQGRYVVILYRGVKGEIASDGHYSGDGDDDDDYQWFTGMGVARATDLQTKHGFERYQELSKITGATSYGVIVY